MKYLIILSFLFLSCQSSEFESTTTDDAFDAVDSAIFQSNHTLLEIESTNRNTDTIIANKVMSTVKKMTEMENEIQRYKVERLQVNTVEKTVEKVVYKVDTVYIESKKNFWGKEKTSKKIVSDSSIETFVDSSSSFKEEIDSTKN